MGEISGPTIDFYHQVSSSSSKRVDPEPPRLHAASLEDPSRPLARAYCQNKKIYIADMIPVGCFPTEVKEICHWCRLKRPEIVEQLDGYKIESAP